MIGIVLVSHSAALAEGLAEMARPDRGRRRARSSPPGGGPDGTLGTRGGVIVDAIREADSGAGVLVLADLGSAMLSVKAALRERRRSRARAPCSPTRRSSRARSPPRSLRRSGATWTRSRGAAEEAWDVRKL